MPDEELRFDITDAWMEENNAVQLVGWTGYNVQYWYIEPNSDGSVTIASFENREFVLTLKDNKPVIQRRTDATVQKWKLIPANDRKKITSTDGTIVIYADPSVSSVATDDLLVEIADKWAIAYRSLINLHGGKQLYSRIIFDCTPPQLEDNVYAYVFGGIDNRVYWGRKDFKYWLIKYQRRNHSDWCFAALHEMGHLFDCDEPWNFETESLTDLCLVYVLEMNNGRANPDLDVLEMNNGRAYPDLESNKTYSASEIEQLYSSHGLFSDSSSYDIWYVSYMLLQIKDQVGWGPFIEAFRSMDANKTQADLSRTRLEMFDAFLATLSHYARTDVSQFLDPAEYQALRTCLGNK